MKRGFLARSRCGIAAETFNSFCVAGAGTFHELALFQSAPARQGRLSPAPDGVGALHSRSPSGCHCAAFTSRAA